MNNEHRITIDSALYKYIEHYAEKVNLSPITACMRVLGETEKVLNLILKRDDHGVHTRIERKGQQYPEADCLGPGPAHDKGYRFGF